VASGGTTGGTPLFRAMLIPVRAAIFEPVVLVSSNRCGATGVYTEPATAGVVARGVVCGWLVAAPGNTVANSAAATTPETNRADLAGFTTSPKKTMKIGWHPGRNPRRSEDQNR
jgi:hypothetical protein